MDTMFSVKTAPRKRTKRARRKVAKKPDPNQTSLTTRKTRAQEESIERAQAQIDELRRMGEIVKGLLTNQNSVVLTALTVERYGNSRLDGPWWFLLLGLHHAEDFEDAPNDEEYEFGSYWRDGHHKDSERYVLDRARWVKPFVEEELKAAEEWIQRLEQPHW